MDLIKYDESPREDTSMEALAKLKPAFKKDGTVTAGNAPGTNDGAAALIVTSERNAQSLDKKPMARIVAQAVSGVEPKWVMQRRNLKRGIAALCLGSGNAVALALEMM